MKRFFFLLCVIINTLIASAQSIDREAVVKRHQISTTATLSRSPAQVGNGNFAFGMDITGLQTFVPFNTMSYWAWHSFPMPEGTSVSDYQPQERTIRGKKSKFFDTDQKHKAVSEWMSKNPQKFNLGRLGFLLTTKEGTVIDKETDVKNTTQEVDLWKGLVNSRFEFSGKGVTVTTSCHPKKDMIAVDVKSDLLEDGELGFFLDFPYADERYKAIYVGDYSKPQAHTTNIEKLSDNSVCLTRIMDDVKYYVIVTWTGDAEFKRVNAGQHRFTLIPKGSKSISLTCWYSQQKPQGVPSENAEQVETLSALAWKQFWKSGAAVDLMGSKDPRWIELERRIILSQYLMRVNEAGDLPPQEAGLVDNSWYGRSHFEMIWWHGMHWDLWNRPELLKYLKVYNNFLPVAKERAKLEGRDGARWPKCTGNFNREWPGQAHAYLVWQMPHPVYFAEMDYRIHPTQKTLEKWKDVVLETGEYMADYPFYNKETKHYDLGPYLYMMSENEKPENSVNPAFELAYWRYGLRVAQQWRQRLGLKPDKKWQRVLNNLAPIPVEDGSYVTYEGVKDMWTKYNFEHPGIIGLYGMLPGDGIDKGIFATTLDRVLKGWNYDKLYWGWDFPFIAMACARTGRTTDAVDMLLYNSHNYVFDVHGYCSGGGGTYPYFPGNGALLTTVAMMCGGWDGCPSVTAPGFPKDGSWTVKYEGFNKMQ